MGQQKIIQLVIAWTLVGTFIFTVIATCGSLVGWIKFAEKSQQKKLFCILIVELVAICVTFFGNFLNYSPKQATAAIRSESDYDYWRTFQKVDVISIAKPDSFPMNFKFTVNDGTFGGIRYDGMLGVFVETNSMHPVTPCFFRPVKFDGGYLYAYDDSRNYTIKLPSSSGQSFLSYDGITGHFATFYTVDVEP